MPTTSSFDSISLDALTSVLGGCGGKKKCCKCPPQQQQLQQAAPQLPPSDNVGVSVSVQQ